MAWATEFDGGAGAALGGGAGDAGVARDAGGAAGGTPGSGGGGTAASEGVGPGGAVGALWVATVVVVVEEEGVATEVEAVAVGELEDGAGGTGAGETGAGGTETGGTGAGGTGAGGGTDTGGTGTACEVATGAPPLPSAWAVPTATSSPNTRRQRRAEKRVASRCMSGRGPGVGPPPRGARRGSPEVPRLQVSRAGPDLRARSRVS
jgi:hypothetical protein